MAFLPVQRELVFDIDLTDYDDVRTCGKEGHICIKCWPLMAIAIEVTKSLIQNNQLKLVVAALPTSLVSESDSPPSRAQSEDQGTAPMAEQRPASAEDVMRSVTLIGKSLTDYLVYSNLSLCWVQCAP